MTIREAFEREVEIRTREYNLLIDQATERLRDAGTRRPSTHLGHNLGSLANELTVAATKVEAAETALRTFDQFGLE